MKHIVRLFIFICALLGASLAYAVPVTFSAHLDGRSEASANASPGVGDALIVFDTDLHTLSVDVNFNGLMGQTSVAHIHCCTVTPGVGNAGVATQVPSFASFPVGVSSGSYAHLFDMTQPSSFNPGFVAANGGLAQAELNLLRGSFAGGAYLNIHTSLFPAGEIRGFLALVPEPGSLILLGIGLLTIGLGNRKRC